MLHDDFSSNSLFHLELRLRQLFSKLFLNSYFLVSKKVQITWMVSLF